MSPEGKKISQIPNVGHSSGQLAWSLQIVDAIF